MVVLHIALLVEGLAAGHAYEAISVIRLLANLEDAAGDHSLSTGVARGRRDGLVTGSAVILAVVAAELIHRLPAFETCEACLVICRTVHYHASCRRVEISSAFHTVTQSRFGS